MELTLPKVTPFLPSLTTNQTARVTAWLPVLQLMLNGRYGAKITDTPDGGNEPLFVSFAADALLRRLQRPGGLIDKQSVGPASVAYNSRAHLAVWFLPEELDSMDGFLGSGGVQSVRMAAPDAIRFGNRSDRYESEEF